jgi:hypothetical protein
LDFFEEVAAAAFEAEADLDGETGSVVVPRERVFDDGEGTTGVPESDDAVGGDIVIELDNDDLGRDG